jgi:hypothetical protein
MREDARPGRPEALGIAGVVGVMMRDQYGVDIGGLV